MYWAVDACQRSRWTAPRNAHARSLLVATLLLVVATPAGAYELSGGVSLGGILVGTLPRFAVSPHAALSWRRESGFLFTVDDLCSILPATGKLGGGAYNQTSIAFGYASKDADFRIGPSFSVYSMPACGGTLCGRVVGVAPGGHAQANVYFGDRFGMSLSANVDWVGGRSLVLFRGLGRDDRGWSCVSMEVQVNMTRGLLGLCSQQPCASHATTRKGNVFLVKNFTRRRG